MTVTTRRFPPLIQFSIIDSEELKFTFHRVGRNYYFTEVPLAGHQLTDQLFIEAINNLALDYRTYHDTEGVIGYSLGCRIGELSGAILPLTPAELTFDGAVNSSQVIRL